MRALLTSPSPVRPAAVGARQGALLSAGLASMLLLPMGLSVGVLVVAGSWVVGAWWWAVQLPEPLPRPVVRQVALSVGVGWGLVVAVGYLALALQPGQLELPYSVLAFVTVAIGTMGGLAAVGLSLCGMDAGRAVTP